MKKTISILLSLLIASSCVLAGCGSKKSPKDDPIEGIEAVQSSDKYRNYYQIFVNSFCDSDGDTIGDIPGIISKLDYLNDGDPNSGDDLGIDGIWLTPIMPSTSYHKYDVDDYYDIDEDFGTLEDFDKLLEECHKRGINVIIDLVLNHISSRNPLYLQAVEEVSEGKLDGAAEYFEIHKSDYFSSDVQVNALGNDYVCEANFSHDMPEWNLNSEKTREEFTNIAKFWLDRGVDGFRLDAVKYYTNKSTDGTEFLKWFYETCQEIKPDVYMVGEDWEDDLYLEENYKSGIDSLFSFKFAQASGTIIQNMLTQKGESTVKKFKSYDEKMTKANEKFINAMFLSNHDQIRAANSLSSYGTSFEKFAASVYMLVPGNSFTYYGEEIGMTAPDTTSDAYYRTGMIWDSNNLPDINVNGRDIEQSAPEDGGVEQQLANDDSLLKFYQRIIKVKNQNPEIARGKITDTVDFDDSNIGAYYVEYEGSKLLIIHNFNKTDSKELTITSDMLEKAEVRADLVTSSTDEHIVLNSDGTLTLPAISTVILKSAE
ncbi:MAG: alpha amylase [Ruminococcus sp.]|nr:alpha amylase [Ruminococcus sp.]